MRRVRQWTCISLILFAVLTASRSALVASGPFHQDGFAGKHALDSAAPNESVDPLSGNLLVTATDLALPGPAGMDLAVTRFYSSQIFPNFEDTGSTSLEEDTWAGLGWRLHWGRILHRETITATCSSPLPSAVVDLPGGFGGSIHKRQPYLTPSFPEPCITDGLARFDPGTNTLKLPNGRIYTFGHQVTSSQHGTVRYVTKIEDPFGNKIEFTYFSGAGPADGVQEIRQYIGASTRVVTFTYNATLKSLASMTYAGRTWTYSQTSIDGARSRLTSVTSPTNAVTTYSYGQSPYRELTQVATPAGGTVTYTYQTITRPINGTSKQARVVATRVTGGSFVTGGTWTFQYSQGTNDDWTYVISPCNRTEYRYLGIGASGPFKPWNNGLMAERRTETLGGTLLEREELTWDNSHWISEDDVPASGGLDSDSDVFKPLLLERTVTRGSETWTTTYAYHAGSGHNTANQNDYFQPYQITETGEGRTRVTTRVFSHAVTPYVGGRVQSETVTENGESTTSSRTFNATTGFVTSATARTMTTTFTPTSLGDVASATDAANRTTSYTYAWGVQKNVTSPLVTITRTINTDGTVANETVGTGGSALTTAYGYDAAGRPDRVYGPGISPSGTPPGTVIYAYDPSHAWVRVTQSEADAAKYNQVTTYVDGFGRVRQRKDSFNVTVKRSYNACGQASYASYPFTSGPEIGTSTAYDALGRPTTVTAPGNAVTSYTYSGNNVTITDAENRATTYMYRAAGGPDAGYLSIVLDARGNTTSYTYDLFANLKSVAVPGVPTRTWSYNSKGLVSSETQPENGTTTYTYDAVGNRLTATNASGQITATYDANHRMATRRKTGDATSDLDLFYNSAGAVWKQEVPSVMTTQYTFNSAGQVATRQDTRGALTWQSSYLYDKRGHLTSLTYPSTRVVTYTYGRESRLEGAGTLANTFIYGDTGQLLSFKTGTVTQAVTLDARNRVRTIGVGSLLNLTYDYDDVGNITALADTRPGYSAAYNYDALHRLTGSTIGGIQQGWTFDAAGNRLAETGTTPSTFVYQPSTQRLTSVSGALNETYQYNALGQLTQDSRGTYAYTPTGRLKTVTGPVTASYGYDPDDLRVARTVNGHTVYTVRGAGQQILSEYQSACTGLVWSRDLLYAGGKLIGAARSTAALPGVEVTATTASVAESATSVSIGVRLTTGGAALGCAVTVAWETRPGTATPGADYTAASGTLIFAAGTPNNAVQTIPLTLLPDTWDEDDETVILAITGVVGAQTGVASAQTLTITDDDASPVLTVGDVTIAEPTSGSVSAVVTATLSNPSNRTVTADVATANGTATAGSDYTATSGSVVFEPGTTSQTISVPVLADVTPETAETFTVAVSNVQFATPPGGPATVTIPENDQLAVTLTANRTFPLAAGTSVTFTAGTTGGAPPYEYLFRLTQHGTGTVRTMQGYAGTTTFAWTPATPGSYTLEAWVRPVGSALAFEGIASLGPFTITAAPAVTTSALTSSHASPVQGGTTVTWTATAAGGVGPLQYQFRVYDSGTATWTVFRDFAPSASAPWATLSPGTFTIDVRVRSAGSAAAYEATRQGPSFTVTLSGMNPVSLTANQVFPVAIGTPVTWTSKIASATQTATYQFLWRPTGSGTWTVGQAYSASTVWTWTPASAGTFNVQVWGKETWFPGEYLTYIQTGSLSVTTGPIGSVGLTASQSVPVTAGMPITWTATATGGTAPLQYQFWLYDGQTAVWSMVRDYSAERTWTWTPAATAFGQVAVQVYIRNTGSAAAYDAFAASGYFTVTP